MTKYRSFKFLFAILLWWGGPIAAAAEQFETRLGVVYAERESGPLKADLYLPQGAGPFPGVLVVHGGAWCMGSRAQLGGFAKMLARHNMVAVAISYRLAPKHKFPAQIEDCKAAVRWMRSQAEQLKIDPQRLGAFGYSAGAHLATLLGTTDASNGLEGVPDPSQHPNTRLQAVAGGGMPCDFRILEMDSKRLAFWLGGTRRQMGDVYRKASPRAFATKDDPPMFFFHGEKDDLVPLLSPQAMCQSLRDVGVSAELYVVPKIGHNFAIWNSTALEMSLQFLANNLAADEQQ
ncbi:MAG TPA: alpha/beta hydrolase [Planctomycetaceae bacterium]|nr:alpha/beta hydrolase [Planctomycetaceae bacterium]